MDYSLLVFIIDWRLFLIENKNLRIEDVKAQNDILKDYKQVFI